MAYALSASHLERFHDTLPLVLDTGKLPGSDMCKMAAPDLDDSLKNLMNTYNELNSHSVEELFSDPSPLEFMRYVARNTPFVIRGGASHWKATQKWNSTYLKSALDGQFVNVAVTPFG